MKVRILSPYPERIRATVIKDGDEIVDGDADFLICYGHREILRPHELARYKRAINLHIGYLPWNRGAHPNFWSWFDNTPKGVTIHEIDQGIDTGQILAQTELHAWDESNDTLDSTYGTLTSWVEMLFMAMWPDIREPSKYMMLRNEQRHRLATSHKKKDIEPWLEQLPLKWETPVTEIQRMGRLHREGAGNRAGIDWAAARTKPSR